MKLRYIVYVPMSWRISDLIMLHPLAAPNGGSTTESVTKLVWYFILVSGLALALFGTLLLVRHSNRRYPFLRNMAQIGLVGLFVGMAGATSNIVQDGTINLFGSGWIGVGIGGFVGAIVVAIVGYFSHKIERLPASFLVRWAWAFVIVGCLIIIVIGIVVPHISPG